MTVAWTTPLNPLAPDEMVCIWANHQSGVFEWICGAEIAAELLGGGMTHINEQPCNVSQVDAHPRLHAIQVRATITQPISMQLEEAA